MLNKPKKFIDAELFETRVLGSLKAQEYRIEYTDSTHCDEGVWTPLLTVTPEFPPNGLLGAEDSQPFYWIAASAAKPKNVKSPDDVIRDAIVQVLMRASILPPQIETETLKDIFGLSNAGAVVLIPDTNALSTGTLHWLINALSNTQVWLLPVVVSLIQVQQRDVLLKSLVGKRRPVNLSRALRSRQLINASLSLLERHRERYQVLEVDPQLLRYVRPAGSGTADHDESDVLEDRLLLEAVHSILRATRSRSEKRVVTSDVLLARMLRTEGVRTIFLQKPALPAGRFPCIRYEPLAKSFVGSPLPTLLWELTHTFAVIRMVDSASESIIQLEAYWPEKSAADWARQCLLVSWLEPPEHTYAANSGLEPSGGGDPAEGIMQSSLGGESMAEANPPQAEDSSPAQQPAAVISALSSAVLLEVSFPQVLRLGNAILEGPGQLADILTRFHEGIRPSSEIARLAAEMLVRAGLVELRAGALIPRDRLSQLATALDEANLDAASKIWENYEAYAIVKGLIQANGSVKAEETYKTIIKVLGKAPSKEGSDRLWRIPVYLGQAWSDGAELLDGSNRPTREKVVEKFLVLFEELQQDGLCLLSNIVPRLCHELEISPWAAAREIQISVEDGSLPTVSFQPSVGKRLVARDQVVVRKDGQIQTVAVPIDRLEIGGRPVFAVARGSV